MTDHMYNQQLYQLGEKMPALKTLKHLVCKTSHESLDNVYEVSDLFTHIGKITFRISTQNINSAIKRYLDPFVFPDCYIFSIFSDSNGFIQLL